VSLVENWTLVQPLLRFWMLGERTASSSEGRKLVGIRQQRQASIAPKCLAVDEQARAPAEPRATARMARPKRLLPEDHLERAMAASTPRSRASWARRGLAHRGPLDRTTQAMLLRQLYLSYFAERDFERAGSVAVQALALDVLPDVIHQDAARAKQAAGDVEGAVGHLRLAARIGPPSRKAFHLWSMGSVLFLARRYSEAVSAFARAARWGTTDKPLYEGHLALAKLGAGSKVRGVDRVIRDLEHCPAGQGYGQFVLGLLSHYRGRSEQARRYLERFIARVSRSQPTMAISLEGELGLARQALGQQTIQ
jgi:tetratricopeptide (TPR) repeat protein